MGRLGGSICALLREGDVSVMRGAAFSLPDAQVQVEPEEPQAGAVILATGSSTAKLNCPGSELPEVIGSAAALSLGKASESVAIVGGVEFATLFRMLRSEITVLEALPRLLLLVSTINNRTA